MPCSADIPIPFAARMAFLLRRAPYENYMSKEWEEKMNRIENCTLCGHCMKHCQYNLDVPSILRSMLDDYRRFKAMIYGK